MDFRERFINTVIGKPVDRVFLPKKPTGMKPLKDGSGKDASRL